MPLSVARVATGEWSFGTAVCALNSVLKLSPNIMKMHNGNVSWQSANVADVQFSKTLFVTVVSFFVLLSPAHIILTFARLGGDEKENVKKSTVALLLIFMTSCTNPFIYGHMNRSFRSEFKKCLMLKRGHPVA